MPAAIAAGVRYSDYSCITFGQLLRIIDFYNKREEDRAMLSYQSAAYSAYHTGILTKQSADHYPRTLHDVFPNLFPDQTEDKAALFEKQFMLYAARHNAAIKR